MDYLACCTDGQDSGFDRAVELAVAALQVQVEAEKNEPLTLEELQEMDGEPVWVKPIGKDGCWTIVNIYGKSQYHVQCVTVASTAWFGTSYGIEWLAYRYKLEEGAK